MKYLLYGAACVCALLFFLSFSDRVSTAVSQYQMLFLVLSVSGALLGRGFELLKDIRDGVTD